MNILVDLVGMIDQPEGVPKIKKKHVIFFIISTATCPARVG